MGTEDQAREKNSCDTKRDIRTDGPHRATSQQQILHPYHKRLTFKPQICPQLCLFWSFAAQSTTYTIGRGDGEKDGIFSELKPDRAGETQQTSPATLYFFITIPESQSIRQRVSPPHVATRPPENTLGSFNSSDTGGIKLIGTRTD